MRTRPPVFVPISVLCLLLPFAVLGNDNLQQVLARMDQAAKTFKSMTAQVTRVTHTEVLNEDDTENATVTMKKVQAGEIQGRVDFTAPDRKTVTIEKRRVQEYLPKANTLQVFDLTKHGEQLDKFFMIGFGTSGTELAASYDMSVLGSEEVNGQSAIHLQLIPRDPQMRRDYVQKVELWIPSMADPYPLREKILQPSGDYNLVTYTNLKINPVLQPDALELKLPPGVKTEYPGK
jgi:outer membrane lipoprotein-sorting protein